MHSNGNNARESKDIAMEIVEPNLIGLTIPDKLNNINPYIQIAVSVTNNMANSLYPDLANSIVPEVMTLNKQVIEQKLVTDNSASMVEINTPIVPVFIFQVIQYFYQFYKKIFLKCRKNKTSLLVERGMPILIYFNVRICWYNKRLTLELKLTDFGFQRLNKSWFFEIINSGVYQLRFIYIDSGKSRFESQFVNLYLIQPSEFKKHLVEVNSICFGTFVPNPVLILPKKQENAENFVRLGICISNNTTTKLYFSFYNTLIPEIITSNGKILRGNYRCLGIIGPRESDFELARHGQNLTFFPDARLFWNKHKFFTLSIAAGDGGFRSFEHLNPGNYKIRFTYKSKKSVVTTYSRGSPNKKLIEGIWTGMVYTPFVELRLVTRQSGIQYIQQ